MNHPGLFLTKAAQAYAVCQSVGSPSCKILFDIYHQQIQEGNLIPNIDAAWDEIAYFQIGDNPGRKEPTTGEINYTRVLSTSTARASRACTVWSTATVCRERKVYMRCWKPTAKSMSSVPDRPQPWLATVLLAAFMLSCTGEPATQSPTPAPNEPAPAAPPFATTSTDRLTNTPTERGFAEKRFERVESMLRRGVLSCDTITYVCPNGRGEGSFTYCSVEGELLLAAHTYARGAANYRQRSLLLRWGSALPLRLNR